MKVKFKWTKIEQDALGKIKSIAAHYILITYTDFIKIFRIHTNASDFQLEEVISHKGKPINLYSITLTYYQII